MFVDHILTMEMSGTVKSVLLLLFIVVAFVLFQVATFVEVNGVFSIFELIHRICHSGRKKTAVFKRK